MIPTKAEIESLSERGMSIKQMATHYGVCRLTIARWRRRLGVTARAKCGGSVKQLPYECIDTHLRAGKLSQKEIAKECGCTVNSVSLRWQAIKPEHSVEKYKAEITRPDRYRHRKNHNRQSPVNILGAMNYDYAAALEKDFHRWHEHDFPMVSYELFKGFLRSDKGQGYLRMKNREAMQQYEPPMRAHDTTDGNRHTRSNYASA